MLLGLSGAAILSPAGEDPGYGLTCLWLSVVINSFSVFFPSPKDGRISSYSTEEGDVTMAMTLLPLGTLGAIETSGTVTFGIWLP